MTNKLDQYHVTELVDRLYEISKKRKELEKKEEQIKNHLKSLDMSVIAGNNAVATFRRETRTYLSKKDIEAAMGPKWVAQYERYTPYTKVLVEAKEAEETVE